MQVFQHVYGIKEGSHSWSEPPLFEPRNYDQAHEKKLGVLELSKENVSKLPPVDTVLADLATAKLSSLSEEKTEPFFLAVGFR